MPASRRWPARVPVHRTATAPTTCCVLWPRLCSTWTGERRARGAAQCGAGAPSHGAGWRRVVPPRPLHRHPQTRVPRPLRRRVRGAPSAGAPRREPWRRRVGARLGTRAGRTRRERSCGRIGRQCGGCFTRARAVPCTRPVYGGVRPDRPSAPRGSAPCQPQKGGGRGTVEAAGGLYGPWTRGRTRCCGAGGPRRPQALPAVADPLSPRARATGDERAARFISWHQAWPSSPDPVHPHCAKRRSSFQPGWFRGGEAAACPADPGDLERWCTAPKGHARRMQGHRPAGVRIGPQGPTRMWTLDAPGHHAGRWTVGDLAPYGQAGGPERQPPAVERGTIMRQARSRKKRAVWRADLEKRYCNAP